MIPKQVTAVCLNIMKTPLNPLAATGRKCALVLAVSLVAAGGWAQDDSQRRESENRPPAAPTAPAPGNLRPAERAFLEQAQLLVTQQRQLGEFGVGNASQSEVRGHAQQIAADYRRLSEAIDGLLRKKGIALSSSATSGDSPTGNVAKAGPEFDRNFVLTLLNLHESTGALFEAATAEIKDADIRELASAQLPMLRGHRDRIVRLRALFD